MAIEENKAFFPVNTPNNKLQITFSIVFDCKKWAKNQSKNNG